MHFAAPDDAYLLVLDANGSVRWVGHGNPDAAGLAELKAQIDALVPRRPPL